MNEKNLALVELRLSAIPRLGLTDLPTPLEPLPRLSKALDGPRLWVKREDCTGLGFGGNKLRKLELEFDEGGVEVVAGHAGPAYGVVHEATLDAIKLAARQEALLLDPVYSGKGFAGLMALIREDRWSGEDNVVFIHTGGTPALFAYGSVLDL